MYNRPYDRRCKPDEFSSIMEKRGRGKAEASKLTKTGKMVKMIEIIDSTTFRATQIKRLYYLDQIVNTDRFINNGKNYVTKSKTYNTQIVSTQGRKTDGSEVRGWESLDNWKGCPDDRTRSRNGRNYIIKYNTNNNE